MRKNRETQYLYCLNLNTPGEYLLENLIFGVTSCDKLITRLAYCNNSYKSKYNELKHVDTNKIKSPLYSRLRVLESGFGYEHMWKKIEAQSKFIKLPSTIHASVCERIFISFLFEAKEKNVIPYTLNKQQGDPLSSDLEEKILEVRKAFKNIEPSYSSYKSAMNDMLRTITLDNYESLIPEFDSLFRSLTIPVEVEVIDDSSNSVESELKLSSRLGTIIKRNKNNTRFVVEMADKTVRETEIKQHPNKEIGDQVFMKVLRQKSPKSKDIVSSINLDEIINKKVEELVAKKLESIFK